MTDHTQGPWEVFTGYRPDVRQFPPSTGRDCIRTEGGRWIAEATHGDNGEADARLIAQAPAFFEAAVTLLAALDDEADVLDGPDGVADRPNDAMRFREIAEPLAEAVRKAKGQ